MVTKDELLTAYAAGAGDFVGADLTGADLARADLAGANLARANLTGANLTGANLPDFQIPQEGDLIVWKFASGLVKMLVPWNARRTACLVDRVCRAEFVRSLWTESGGPQISARGGVYIPGEETRPDDYDPDPRIAGSHGVHFFLTRAEAEKWR